MLQTTFVRCFSPAEHHAGCISCSSFFFTFQESACLKAPQDCCHGSGVCMLYEVAVLGMEKLPAHDGTLFEVAFSAC